MPVFFHARQTLVALSLLVAIGLATPLLAQKDAGTIVGVVHAHQTPMRRLAAILVRMAAPLV